MYGSYYSSFGDSGAPVYYNPSIPYYEGLSWGTAIDSTHSRSVFSLDFPRLSRHLQRLDRDSRQEVGDEATRTTGV
jgi:hypothetical protein